MVPYKTPFIARFLWPGLVWRFKPKAKTIYLTFDDGPIPNLTEWVLDELLKFDAKATFFCVGENIDRYPEIVERIVKEGHTIGNHTQNHLNGWSVSTSEYLENIAKCDQSLEKLELTTSLFRPPYGRLRFGQSKALADKRIIMWDIISKDYQVNLSPDKILQKIVSLTASGSIVVFHDNLKAEANLKTVLPQYLAHFKSLGYAFNRIE